MRRARGGAALAALACGLLGVAGCGGDEEVARRKPGPAIAPAGDETEARPADPGNSPPQIDSVRFEPPDPGVGQSVRAVVSAVDPDGDPIRLGFVWSVDGESVEAQDELLQLPRPASRGSEVELRVTASDGQAESEAYVATLRVGNRPPRLSSLTIQPAGKITSDGPIMAVALGVDPDGDAVSYLYTWTVNDETSDERGSVFPDTELKRGDVVRLSVVASDEQSESEPLVSPPIEIQNATPVIRSLPDFSGSEGVFSYRIVGSDADGDLLRYGAGKVPEGMSVAADSGLVSWTPRADQVGVHAVELWADDPQGSRATQRFELTIGAPAATPVAKQPAAEAQKPAPPAAAADDEAAEEELSDEEPADEPDEAQADEEPADEDLADEEPAEDE